MKYKYIIALTLCAAAFQANAQQWVKVTESNSSIFYVQSGSVKLGENDSNVKVVIATGKVVNISTNKISGHQWYIPVSHCLQKRGKLVVTDPAGNFQNENDFIYGLGNIASSLAEIICDVMFDSSTKQPPPPSKNNI